MNRSHRLLASVLLLCLQCSFFQAPSVAEDSPGEASAEDAQSKSAQLRGWLFPGGSRDEVKLSAALASAETNMVLAASSEGTAGSSPAYRAIDEGEVSLEARSGEKVLASARVALRGRRHYTVAAWYDGTKWNLKVFADGLSPQSSAERPLRVLNFTGDRDTVVTIGRGKGTRVSPDSVQEFKTSPGITMVSVEVVAADGGPPALSVVEVDLAAMPSAYLVVGPDYRGRMRPRIIEGGEIKEPEVPPDAAAGTGQM